MLLRRSAKSPEYTRRQWIMKGVQLYLCAIAMDLAGAQIYHREVLYALRQASFEEAFYSPQVLYYYAVVGLALGLATWKLFEMYWWAKDRVEAMEKLRAEGVETVIFSGVTEFTNNFTGIDDAMRPKSEVRKLG